LTNDKPTLEQIRSIRDELDCSIFDVIAGLRLRENSSAFAKEWIQRHGLACVMSETARYPLWYEYVRNKPESTIEKIHRARRRVFAARVALSAKLGNENDQVDDLNDAVLLLDKVLEEMSGPQTTTA